MAAYYKVDVSLNTNAVEVGLPSPQTVNVTIPLVGPAGPQGPAGTAGASAWSDITGKPATFPPSTHAATHEQGGADPLELDSQQVLVDSVFLSTSVPNLAGIYLRNGSDNGKPLYENSEYRSYFWWDSDLSKWFLANSSDVNLFQSSSNTAFPYQATSWSPVAPQTGTVDVDQAQLFDVSDQSIGNPSLLRTARSGNATSTELVLGSDTRLTNSRTPTSHASTHYTGGSDALTAANISAAPAVTVIELTPSPGSTTITTSQLPARGIAYIEGGGSFTVNLPTPDKRQSGLTFSIKVEHEGASGDVFITVVHNASDLLTSYELDEDESSLDFLWDGYRWTYSSANWLYSYPNRRLVIPPLSGTLGLSEPSDTTFRVVGSSDATKKVAFEVDGLTTATTRTLTVPDASGTIALTSDFAAPPAIGNTTPAAGTFTTLTATPTSGSALTLTGGTVTASAPLIDATQTWNASGTTFTGVRFNIINAQSATASIPLDFQIGGSPVLQIRRDGTLRVGSTDVGVGGGYAIGSNNGGFTVRASSGCGWNMSGSTITTEICTLIEQRHGTNAQEYRLFGTFTSSTNYQRMTVKSVKQTLSALSGASATTTGTFIPDGAVVVGVTTRVGTLLTGATGYTIGDGTDADRWGDITGTAVGTTSDNRDWTAATIECFTAGGNITLTAKTSNFTAGAIEICVFYLAGEAD
jgi:hypothetical protein